jgi:hypothetical protein
MKKLEYWLLFDDIRELLIFLSTVVMVEKRLYSQELHAQIFIDEQFIFKQLSKIYVLIFL